MEQISTTCCIAGGGPAGMMLGFLLARAGVDVVVLEKHARLPARLPRRHHPSLDARADARARPARRLPEAAASGGRASSRAIVGDTPRHASPTSRHLPTHCKFIALMPQWDFLDFLARARQRAIPSFHLRMQAEVTELIEEGGRIVGVQRARRRTGRSTSAPISSSAPTAAIRRCASGAGLAVDDLGAPIDVLWMRLSRQPSDPARAARAASAPARSWSCSTAATTGSAPS